MKFQIILFVSIFLLVGQLNAQTQIPNYVPTTGLVGWWPFNGNANDESGNGNNGVVYASTVLTTDRYNVLSKAYLFNGTTQSAIINSLQLTNTTTGLAASVWFNSNIALNTSAGHRMFISGTNNIPYQFAYNNGGIDLELYNSSGALTVYTIPITFLANTWNHVVFSTNTNSSVLIYINGVMYNAGNAPSSFRSTNNSKYMFGMSSSAFWPVPFNGKLDDIGIWNRALTQQEVNELYTSSDPFDVSATTTTICAGQPTTLSVQSLPGTISSLTCTSATNNGTLTAGVAASGVNSVVPYTSGNGGLHNGQTVSSTGVTGLTATLNVGTFSTGNGSLTYTITGTPNTSGTASFTLNIGGQTCTLSRTVAAGTITGLTCASATNNGTLTAGVLATGVNSVVPYTGGNGGMHNGQTVSSTGITGLTATLTAGTFASGSGSLTYTITGTPNTSGTASFALNIGGQTCALTRTVAAGTITGLTCASASNNGTLTAGVVASGVSSIIPYTGGNGGTHSGQTVASTGITGLTATLTAGSFANGAGSLSYIITGTPSTSGTASFALNIGGQTCTLTRIVATLVSQFPTGSVFCTANPTAIVNVTNPTTGRIWMDRNLGATQVATSSTDANAYGDLYQWGRKSDGHQCRTSTTTSTLSSTDTPVNSSYILAPNTPFDWRSPQNDNLWQGLNGVNNPCPSGYRIPNSTELNNEVNSWSAITTLDAFNSVLKFPAAGSRHASLGTLNNVGGNVTLWTSTVQSISSLGLGTGGGVINSQNRSRGQSVRCIKEIDGSIGALNCGSSTLTGNLISGLAASGVSASVPYTGGNGGYYAAQSIGSTGITGLTASISQGLFASGSGNLVYTITGTPSASGTASFALNIGGQNCTLNVFVVNNPSYQYPTGSVFCNEPTLIVDVFSPMTGKFWMDRNLGATQVATSITDANSYGDLYQWGRRSDGHQCRNSATTSTLSSTDQPSHGSFIVTNFSPNDWRSPQNNTRWQGVNGVNNPCPSGYRIPTVAEFDAERLSWSSNNAAGAIASPLKLPMAGRRVFNTGSVDPGSPSGFYWTSGVSLPYCQDLVFSATSALPASNLQWISFGDAVRCIKN